MIFNVKAATAFSTILLSSVANAAVVESAAAGTCDNFCQSWYSKTTDAEICNYLQSSLTTYAACGNCEITGATDAQQPWADLWNAEITSWGIICPAEQSTQIGLVVFSNDGVESIDQSGAGSGGAATPSPAATTAIATVTAPLSSGIVTSTRLTGNDTSSMTSSSMSTSTLTTSTITSSSNSSARPTTTLSGSNSTTSGAETKLAANGLFSLAAIMAIAIAA